MTTSKHDDMLVKEYELPLKIIVGQGKRPQTLISGRVRGPRRPLKSRAENQDHINTGLGTSCTAHPSQ